VAVVVVTPPETKGRDIAWFFKESKAREYIKLMEKKRRKR
jgi:hypothetical protein